MSTIVALRTLFILGLINAATALLLFLTCRCLPTSRIGKKGLMAHRWFVRVYKYHCYLWWIFWGVGHFSRRGSHLNTSGGLFEVFSLPDVMI